MIISASRRTDIPAYFSEWFVRRIEDGSVCVQNPFNPEQISRYPLSPETTDCIVFWSKNPSPMVNKLDRLRDYMYYFQFTISPYDRDLEPNLPDKQKVLIPTFKTIASKIGKERVVWRYDPILISDKYSIEYHLSAFENIAKQLSGYTEKVVVSFIDLYKNAQNLGIRELAESEMILLATEFVNIATKYNITVESCAEKIDLSACGVQHGCCIDKSLIERLIGCNLDVKKDGNQRPECGCVSSIDVGLYNSCQNGCRYCYANYDCSVIKNTVKHYDVNSPILCSEIPPFATVTDKQVTSLKDYQLSMF